MALRQILIVVGVAAGIAAAVEGVLLWSAPRAAEHATPSLPPPIDAAQIATGRLPMERLPTEIGRALDMQSDEIVKNAEALEGKQARITGTCAPGSAIRVIAENGTVSCQHLPKGVVSVAAITAIPIVSTTPTEPASVPGGLGRYQTGGEDDFLVAPVVLPDGALVTGFSYAFYDDAPEIDGSAFLYRSDAQPMAQVTSNGAAADVRTASTER